MESGICTILGDRDKDTTVSSASSLCERGEDRVQDLLDRISVETAVRNAFTRISVECPVPEILYL